MLQSTAWIPAPARTASGTVALVDRGWPETGRVTARGTASVFAGFRFPREVISLAVRWYLRYGLSYRDVEELLADLSTRQIHRKPVLSGLINEYERAA
jgi:hypothetical protein